jgi:hypothetical protein
MKTMENNTAALTIKGALPDCHISAEPCLY